MVARQNTVPDTDKPSKRIPLLCDLENRAASLLEKDARYINFYSETNKEPTTNEKSIFLIKRPGVTLNTTVVSGGALARGCYYWNGKLWSVWGSALYRDTTLTATTLDTSTGVVGFCEVLGTNNYLFFCDGEDGYYINTSNTITKITDAQFPTPHIPVPVYMDGYIFVALANTGEIHNSALEDPSSWLGEFIDTEMYPDAILGLARMNNQVVAFGRMSTEFFYDAANVSTSPLGRTEGSAVKIGTCAPYAVAECEQYIIMPSQSEIGGKAIHMFKGFEPKKISTSYVDKLLDAEGTSLLTDKGYCVSCNGHKFYLIHLNGQDRTLVYDLEEQKWSEWSSNSSNDHVKFAYKYVADDTTGKAILQHATDGKTYRLSAEAYDDNGTTIICEGTTRKFDYETMSRKFHSGLYWVADNPGATTSFTFRWSDDDYQSWSNWKTIDLYTRPFFPRLGTFRRRAFNFKCTASVPLRIEGIEFVDLQTGNH